MYTKFDEIKATLGIFEKYLKQVKDEFDEHYAQTKNLVNANMKPDNNEKMADYHIASELLIEDGNEYRLCEDIIRRVKEIVALYDYNQNVLESGMAEENANKANALYDELKNDENYNQLLSDFAQKLIYDGDKHLLDIDGDYACRIAMYEELYNSEKMSKKDMIKYTILCNSLKNDEFYNDIYNFEEVEV